MDELPRTRRALSQFTYDVSKSENGSEYAGYTLYNSPTEQSLAESHYDEFCQLHGLNVTWVRRQFINEDGIIGEDRYSLFSGENAFKLKLYPLDFRNYNPNVYFGHTQLSYPNRAVFHITKNRFAFETENAFGREFEPQIGDIFLIELTNDIWSIEFNEPESVYYERGKAFVWEFNCKPYIHSGENFETGNDEFDLIVNVDDFDLFPPEQVTGDNTRIEEDNEFIDDTEQDIYGGL